MNYCMYNDDCCVASFDVRNGLVTGFVPLREELLPMQLVGASAERFVNWLSARAIDLNAVQHRQLVHALTGSRDKLAVSIATHMFSISDTFTCFAGDEWIPRSQLCNAEEQEEVSRFILVSSDTTLRRTGVITPNASTDGSFTKTWQYENGEWWLYKLQPAAATMSEYEISKALRRAGFDAAEYRTIGRIRTRIRTRNFVGANEFFEPYESLRYMFADKSDDDDVISANIQSLGGRFAEGWQDILMADAFFQNTDRHMRNFGVIRSSKTGEILRLAPNFDNNQAYKANPGGRYSDAMLRMLCRNGLREKDRDRFERLIEASGKSRYLSDAAEAGKRILDSGCSSGK